MGQAPSMFQAKKQRLIWLILVLCLAALQLGAWLYAVAAGSAGGATVSGTVVDEQGALAGARVRIRATDNLTRSDANGHFLLQDLTPGQPVQVTAWYTGYYIAGQPVTPTAAGITLTLRPYHTHDHPGYDWTSPISGTSAGACGRCHPMIMPQWHSNAHGQAVTNPRFFSLYDGANLSGTAVITPGYRLDFPGTAGNCANCHAPGAGIDGYLTTVMDDVRQVITAGIHCDFCHKVGGVYLDPATGTVYPNAPGVQSQQVLRPPAGDNIFFGPYDDIPDPDTYLPVMAESQFCAPCHQFSFWGTPIYESYNEWLASAYPDEGITCQRCHMPPNGDQYFALPEMGGLPHPPEQIPSHLQPGAADADLLQKTVSMTVSARQVGGQLWVTVVITNTGAGHHVPTDHPGRNMILTVTAVDNTNQPLFFQSGPTVPAWGGPQGGQPGQLFAKVLQDALSGDFPVVSYWKQSVIYSDNRIAARETAVSTYIFNLPPAGGPVEVEARLIFRRLFWPLAEERDWNSPDILMTAVTINVPINPPAYSYLPLMLKE